MPCWNTCSTFWMLSHLTFLNFLTILISCFTNSKHFGCLSYIILSRLLQMPQNALKDINTNFYFPSLQHHAPHIRTSIVSGSWWWAYECPKHVEQFIRTINHQVSSSWFFFSTYIDDARTHAYQIFCNFVCLRFTCFSRNLVSKTTERRRINRKRLSVCQKNAETTKMQLNREDPLPPKKENFILWIHKNVSSLYQNITS
jgi:hypothetical protein